MSTLVIIGSCRNIYATNKHPNARPAEIDPVQKLVWEDSEIVDVLSTIHFKVLRGVVLGDYVIECILYQVFENFRVSRNHRRARRARRRSNYDPPSMDEGSTSFVDIAEFRFDETDGEFMDVGGVIASETCNQ